MKPPSVTVRIAYLVCTAKTEPIVAYQLTDKVVCINLTATRQPVKQDSV